MISCTCWIYAGHVTDICGACLGHVWSICGTTKVIWLSYPNNIFLSNSASHFCCNTIYTIDRIFKTIFRFSLLHPAFTSRSCRVASFCTVDRHDRKGSHKNQYIATASKGSQFLTNSIPRGSNQIRKKTDGKNGI